MEEKLHINSLAVHSGTRKDDAFGAINEPIYMTSNYRIPTDGTPVDWSGIHSNIYQRNRNPNQMVLQDKLCALTGAEDGAVFASGVAALAAVWHTPGLRKWGWRAGSLALGIVIIAATLFVKQHAFIDVLAGLFVGALGDIIVYVVIGKKRDRLMAEGKRLRYGSCQNADS